MGRGDPVIVEGGGGDPVVGGGEDLVVGGGDLVVGRGDPEGLKILMTSPR